MKYQQKSSLWLYQLGIADKMATSGAITERVADELYTLLLREPSPADWSIQPLETLTVWMAPSAGAYEHWFDLALQRDQEKKRRGSRTACGADSSC